MMDYGEIEAGNVPEDVHERAGRIANDYTVSFFQGDEQRGSGTLFEINGMKGILTAHHVAEPLLRDPSIPINLIFRDDRHIFELPHNILEHWTLPWVGGVFGGARWPDISFLRILDREKVSTLAASKSFYPYRNTEQSTYLRDFGSVSPYIVMGAPLTGGSRRGLDFVVTHFCGVAQFNGMESIEGFGLLKVDLFAGDHGFPESYAGVSGGGIWAVPLVKDFTVEPPAFTCDSPVLVAVAFYQSDLESNTRVISGIKIEAAIEALIAEGNIARIVRRQN